MATIKINGEISMSAFENQSTITSVKFGSGCNSVGKNAFKKCISLSEINDDNVIKSIDTEAFGNTALESVKFNELEILGTSIFENCSKLSYVNIPKCSKLCRNAFLNCSNLISIDAKNCTNIESKAFEGCTNLSYVIIPNCINIPNNMFSGFRNLTSIKLDNLKSIGYGVFQGCEKLNSIDIRNCEKINSNAFLNCSSLLSIYIPNCSIIYSHAFRNCINLQSVFIGTTSNNRDLSLYIGSYAFSNCQKLSNINLKLARAIGEQAFSNCISLKKLDLYNCQIQSRAFNNCKNLEKVSLINCVPIGFIPAFNVGRSSGIFYGCDKLTNLDLSGFTIRNYEFAECKNLSKVILKNCGSSIGNSAFFNCYNLKEVYIYGSELLSLGGSDVFNYMENTPGASAAPISGLKIYVKAGQKETYKSLPNWSQYTDKIIEMFGNNQISYTTDNTTDERIINTFKGKEISNSDYSDVNKELENDIEQNKYFKTEDYGLITFTNDVSNLENEIFSNNKNLISMKIPYTCENIGERAFQNCENLKEINFMENLSESETAYTGEYDQTKITKQKLTTIQEYAFQNCKSLTSFEIPNGVTEIGIGAFQNCESLTSFEIPNSVTEIGSGAFEGCVNIEQFKGDSKFIKYDNKAIVYNEKLIYVSPKDDRDILRKFCDISKIISKSDSNITTLGKGCFNACENLMRIDIPDSVKKIESGVFKGCKNLCEIHFKGKKIPDIEDDVKELFFDTTTDLNNKDRIIIIFFPKDAIEQYVTKLNGIKGLILYPKPNDTEILYKTSDDTGYTTIKKTDRNQNIPTSATTVIFGENINVLKEYTFKDCTKLDYVYLPNNITTIGEGCFYNCSSLKNIRIPYNVSSFGDKIFYGCKALKEFYSYKDGCVSDDKMCYFNNNNLQFFAQGGLSDEKTYTIDKNITAINKYVFKDVDIKSITINNSGIKTIDSYAFDNCQNLTNITMSSVENISDYAFNNCSELIEIDIPNIESIGQYAFKDCKKMYLKSQMNNVTTISDGAFYGCSNFKYLESLTPETQATLSLGKIKCINKETFKGCTSLESVDLTNNITSIGESAFEGCESLTNLYNDVKNLKIINRRAFYNCAKLKTINIQSLTEIGDEAFKNCTMYNIDSFPRNVENIGKSCFENSGIINLKIENSKLKNISEYAFYNCTKLKTVDLSNSIIEIFEKYSFSNNNLLYKIYLPSTLTWIKNGVFYKCKSLYNIILPKNLNKIGHACLETWTSDTKIYIQESLKTPPQFTMGNDIRSCYPFGKPNAISTPIIYVKAELGDIYKEQWRGKFYEIKTFTDFSEIPNLDNIPDPNL